MKKYDKATGPTIDVPVLDERKIDRALQYVNAALEACGQPALKRIPKGMPHDSRRCPLARALQPLDVKIGSNLLEFAEARTARKVGRAWAGIAGVYVSAAADPRVMQMPRPLRELRRAVDLGRAPRLVSKAAASRKAPGRALETDA